MNNRFLSQILAFLLRRLGELLAARGLEGIASYYLAQAFSIDPGATADLYEKALACWHAGDQKASQVLLRRLVEQTPGHARAANLLGAIHFTADEFDAAESFFRQALALAPDLAAAHNNLGNIHVMREDFAAAEPLYRAALQHDPDYAEALNNLGMVLCRQGAYEEAERSCRRALQVRPAFAGALNNLGNALLGQDRRGEAIECYREALTRQADLPEAHLNLAAALNDPEQLVGVLDHFRRILQNRPDSYIAHLRVGTALQIAGDWGGSEYHLLAAERLRPSSAEVAALRGNNAGLLGDYASASRLYRRALQLGAAFPTHGSFLFNLLYDPQRSPAEFLREAREWSILHAEPYPKKGVRSLPETTGRRLRIGYLSKDFARHSVSYFIEPVIAHHDRSRFEVYCYSNNPKPDAVTERIKGLVEHWRDIAFIPDAAACEQIVGDGIDILVDLSGHTAGNRLKLMASKPAPLQANYLGYPATTAMPAIDYRFVDAITDPPGEADRMHTEKLVRLPGCFLTYQPPADAADVVPPPSIARGYVTFGSFNNAVKVNPGVVAAWAKILHAVPGSRLMLKGFAFSAEQACERFRDMFQEAGIGAERVDLLSWHPDVMGHLDLYGQIDIALDTFPYNGTTTTCEALWMGVPVLSLEGERHSARVGASLLTAAGLREFVSSGIDDLVARAARLATDAEWLSSLRANLRERLRSSPLLDSAAFARCLESAYEAAWRDHAARQAAVSPGLPESNRTGLADLRLPRGVRVLLPDSLEVMTRYVIEEQGDWFEQEAPFLRELIQPGMKIIDIGANFGAYALSLAECTGSAGRVWAFEPSPSVAAALRASSDANGFSHVEVLESAVAERSGRAGLMDRGGAEFLQIVIDGTGAGRVPVTSLDEWFDAADRPVVDFVKIDAEGSEAGIVRGGGEFLAARSPLVMAEYLNGAERNDEMIQVFASLGYAAWRLAPGLQLLAPVAPDSEAFASSPPLNLFFCKPDRAAALAADDRLVPTVAQSERPLVIDGAEALYGLCELPFARPWAESWAEWMRQDESAALDIERASYRSALKHYALCRNESAARTDRWRHLEAALDKLDAIARADAPLERRLTHARLLYDAGLAQRAHDLVVSIIPDLMEERFGIAEPFIPPCPRYERIAPAAAVADWLLACCLEQQEIIDYLTGFLDPPGSLRRLRDIRDLGHGDANILHRIDLIVRRFDRRAGWVSENMARP